MVRAHFYWTAGAIVLAMILFMALSRPEPEPPYVPTDFTAMNAVETCTRSAFQDESAHAQCRYERARERLALVRDRRLSGPYLGRAGLAALDAGFPVDAQRYAADARTLIAELSGSRLDGRTFDAEEHAAIIEGRLALASGDTATAQARLLDAGSVLESPAQTSFGPNTSLARDLIGAGDTATVRAYFDTLSRTWPARHSAERLRTWRAALDHGEMPDFGATLFY